MSVVVAAAAAEPLRRRCSSDRLSRRHCLMSPRLTRPILALATIVTMVPVALRRGPATAARAMAAMGRSGATGRASRRRAGRASSWRSSTAGRYGSTMMTWTGCYPGKRRTTQRSRSRATMTTPQTTVLWGRASSSSTPSAVLHRSSMTGHRRCRRRSSPTSMTTAGTTKAMMKTNARTPWSSPARRAKATKKNP